MTHSLLLLKNEKIPHLSRFFFRFRKAILPEKTYPEIFFYLYNLPTFVPLSLLEEFRISGWFEFRIMEYVSRTDIYNNKLVSRKSWNTHSFPCVTLSSGGRVFSSNIRITHKSVRPGREWHASGALSLSLSLSATAINHNESVLPGEGSVFPRPLRAGPLPLSLLLPSCSFISRAETLQFNLFSAPSIELRFVLFMNKSSRFRASEAGERARSIQHYRCDTIRFDSTRFDSIAGGRKEGEERNDEERMKGGRLTRGLSNSLGGIGPVYRVQNRRRRMEESEWKGDAGV